MSSIPDYFTLWYPFGDEDRPVVIRCKDDETSFPLVKIEDFKQAWDALGPKEGEDWVCSERLAAKLGGDATEHVGLPTEQQSVVVYNAIIDLLNIARNDPRLGESEPLIDFEFNTEPKIAVFLLKKLAQLKAQVDEIESHGVNAYFLDVFTPGDKLHIHGVFARNERMSGIAVSGELLDLKTFMLSNWNMDGLEFNLLYAGYTIGDSWIDKAIEDITGQRFMPTSYQYSNQKKYRLSNPSACILASVANGLTFASQDLRAVDHPCMTPRGSYSVDIAFTTFEKE